MAAGRSADNCNGEWFEHLSRVNSPSLRLFCFPYAGGSAEVYRGWQRWFPEHVDVCLVHLPGRGKRIAEQAFTRRASVVDVIAERIGCETSVRYALYGHSMGALTSFELGRKLFANTDTRPEHIFLSGHRAPQWPRDERATFNLPYDEFIEELKRLDGTPVEVLDNSELLEIFLGLLRADFEMVETYQYLPGKPLACPFTVYGGLQDKLVPVESCQAWHEQTSAGCKVRIFPGDHFFIRNPGPEFVSAFRNDVLRVACASRRAGY